MQNPIKKFITVVKNGYSADTAKVRSANRVSSTASDRRRVMKEPAITRAYNQSALARAVIDIPANMSLSQWRTWKADTNHTEAITKAERELDIQRKMIQAHTIARKDGGAVVVIGTAEEDYSTPLDPSKIGRNGIEFLSVMTRYMFSRIDINLEPGTPGFGEALMFHLILTANPGASSMPREVVDKDITMIHP
nr:DUF1073 domain-containing protein [Gammaproteobacteria bacterium]